MTAGGNSFKNATAHKVNSYYTCSRYFLLHILCRKTLF